MSVINETHAQILDVAEQLFAQRGYKTVRLRDIADAVDIKHAALYYYAKNKEALYMQVMERSFTRHRIGMEEAIHDAGPDLYDQVRAVAQWLAAHPPLNMAQIAQSDFAELKPENAAQLSTLLFDALRQPLETALVEAQATGITDLEQPGLAAIAFITLVQTVHSMNLPPIENEKSKILDAMVDMFLKGWLKR